MLSCEIIGAHCLCDMQTILFKPIRNDIDPCAPFRERLARQRPVSQGSFPLMNNIVAVGALYSAAGLSENDQDHFSFTLDACRALGIDVSDQFHLTPVNPACHKDQDFLRPDFCIPADLLAVWHAYNPSLTDADLPNTANLKTFFVSPHHFDEDAWYRKAAGSGAKVIVPIAGYLGIDPSDIDQIVANAPCLRAREDEHQRIWSAEINAAHFMGPRYAVVSNDFLPLPVLVRTDLAKKLLRQNGLKILMPVG